jgi:hypothetical protein
LSRDLEIRLKPQLESLMGAYIRAFPHSFAKFNRGPVDFTAELEVYAATLDTFKIELVRAAAFAISGYANLYGVYPNNGFDEFKKIYFLGRAIERRLTEANNVRIAKIHMFSMIGMMDAHLQKLGIRKQPLTRAMTRLIRSSLDDFDKQLGQTGCYLIYKCSSTAPKHAVA